MTALLRFFPRQLADHLLTRGAAMLIIGVVFLLPWLLGGEGMRGPTAAWGPTLRGALDNVTPFLILIATYGIVDQDLRRGFYRFLFARPISPVAYYAQALLAAALSYLIVLVLLVGVFAAVQTPAWPGGPAVVGWSLQFLLLGALVFLFSRFSRLDWVFAVAVFIIADIARRRWPGGETLLGDALNVVLPPVHRTAYFVDGTPAWGSIAWTGGYAALLITVALCLVRFIPLGERR